MEFTKEEIKTALLLLSEYEGNSLPINFEDYLKSKLKPETKKIRVEIEYDVTDKVEINLKGIYYAFKNSFSDYRDIKVTELKDIWTDEDMIEFAKECINAHRNPDYIDVDYLNDYLAGRNSK